MPVVSSVDSYINAQPEQAMTYADYYEKYSGFGTSDYDNIFMKIIGGLSGTNKKMEDDYRTYLDNLNKKNEFLASQSSRAWDKMMDDTKYQRMMKDFERAGLNPYLLVNDGGISAASSPSSSKANYDSKWTKEKSGSSGRDVALLLIAAARLVAALL